MPQKLPAGPYRVIPATGAPFYIIPFDKNGVCLGPKTAEHLADAVSTGGYTDVYVFSHGWNNHWEAATSAYDRFIKGFAETRQKHGNPARPYKPLLVGIFWPSIILVGEEERGPAFAGAEDVGATAQDDHEVAEAVRTVQEIAEQLPSGQVERFYELAQKEELTEPEARELIDLLKPLYTKAGGTEDEGEEPADTADLLRAGAKAGAPAGAEPGAFGRIGDNTGGGPAAAGISLFDPRNILRPFTVWQMKGRAGVVGAKGVGPLLRRLLSASASARFHLIGHSYGAKVLLSALCSKPAPVRKVDSVLLLQPAINRWCFADDVDGNGFPGGYRSALERSQQPILTTVSKKDRELHKLFHLAVRRKKEDLGEPQAAFLGSERFGALGGYGPAGCPSSEEIPILLPPTPYQWNPAKRVYALRADDRISGHGDVNNEVTWWALHQQVT